MMDEKFVKEIAGLGACSTNIEVVDDLSLDKVLVRHGSRLKDYERPPMKRAAVIDSIDDVVRAARDPGVASVPEVWHNHEKIVLVCERTERRDRCTMAMGVSSRFRFLRDIGQKPLKGEPRDLVRKMRFALPGTGIEHVITALSTVNFKRTSEQGSDVSHGRESVGKSVMAEVQQAGAIPETFDVTLPVYVNPGLEEDSVVIVQCGVYVDLQAGEVHIQPMADEISRAVMTAQGAVGQKLREGLGEIPVYHGAP